MTTSRPDSAELEAFIARAFPSDDGEPFVHVEHIDERTVRLRKMHRARHLRPGQTVSGPTQMALCDTAAWLLIMHNLGFDAAPSVTSNLNISFLSRPLAVDMVAEGSLLKLGKRLSVAEVRLFSEGRDAPVAHATVTYAVLRQSEQP
jgi:uncharacterized protein (TIGR00369 family)